MRRKDNKLVSFTYAQWSIVRDSVTLNRTSLRNGELGYYSPGDCTGQVSDADFKAIIKALDGYSIEPTRAEDP